MKYWPCAHYGVMGVAGSNPVVPTFFKLDYLTLYNLKYLYCLIFVGFFAYNLILVFSELKKAKWTELIGNKLTCEVIEIL